MIKKLSISALILFNILLASAIVNAWTHGTVAQSVLTSLSISGTDQTAVGAPSAKQVVSTTATFNGSVLGGSFGDAIGSNMVFYSYPTPGGANTASTGSDSGNSNKTTWAPIATAGFLGSWGQKFGIISAVNSYAMGDAAPYSFNINYAGGPIAGDEGSASVFQSSFQQSHLNTTTINAPPTQSACSTTLTGAVPSPTVTTSIPNYTVTVASTTGCNVNDWVVVESSIPNGYPQNEAVQLTAVNPGVSITAQFKLQHSSGVPVKGALVIPVANVGEFGQGRILVNKSGSSYSTGTVTAVGTGTGDTTGSGTTWDPGGTKVGPVGGSTDNVGCISLTYDDFSGSPFSAGAPLKSWYQITSIIDNTHLDFFSFSVAGDRGYHHNGTNNIPGPTPYIIRPCVEVLQVVGFSVIAEHTTTTWTNGDSVELALAPYPDVSQLQYSVSKFTPGGVFRGQMQMNNSGSTTALVGVSMDAFHMSTPGAITAGGSGYTAGSYNLVSMTGGSCTTEPKANITVSGGAVTGVGIVAPGVGCISGDVLSANAANIGGTGSGFQWTFNGSAAPVAYNTGLFLQGANIGLNIVDAQQTAILLPCGVPCGTPTASGIAWNSRGMSLNINETNAGLNIGMTDGSDVLAGTSSSKVGSGSLGRLEWDGFIRLDPHAQSTLPTCAAGSEGAIAAINDANSTTYLAAISPAGSSHVIAYCDGTSWKVH